MSMNFKIYKNIRYGWTAESALELPDNRALKILTMKRHGGAIATTVQVVKIEDNCESFFMFQDYRKTLINEKKRCTEAFVRDQHYKAIHMLPDILPEIYEQYGFDKVENAAYQKKLYRKRIQRFYISRFI